MNEASTRMTIFSTDNWYVTGKGGGVLMSGGGGGGISPATFTLSHPSVSLHLLFGLLTDQCVSGLHQVVDVCRLPSTTRDRDLNDFLIPDPTPCHRQTSWISQTSHRHLQENDVSLVIKHQAGNDTHGLGTVSIQRPPPPNQICD